MKHFDLFSGYGGFTLALERVYANNRELLPSQTAENLQGLLSEFKSGQARTIGFSEIDKYASAVLKYHWPNTKNYGDISKINWAEVPDFDLLTGGSPCQDLSIAGKRAGLSGQRSGSFYEFMRAVKEKKPRYFIWENVKGALSSNNGWDFAAVINEMAETGYSLWWQVLNAKDFGVPQNRERIFVIGFRDGSPREVFFERSNDETHFEQDTSQSRRILKSPIRSQGDKPMIKQLNNPTHSNNRLYSEEGISPALNTAQGRNRQPKIVRPVLTPDRLEKRQNGRRFKEDGEPSFTLNTQDRHGVYDGMKFRRLTPTECERLMGLPEILKIKTPSYEYFRRAIQSEAEKESTTPQSCAILRDLWSCGQSSFETPSGYFQRARENFSGVWFVPFENSQGVSEDEMCNLRYYLSTESAKSIKTLWEKRMFERNGSPFGDETMAQIEGWTAKGIINGKEVEISDSQRYKLCGNGVVVNVVEEIIKHIIL